MDEQDRQLLQNINGNLDFLGKQLARIGRHLEQYFPQQPSDNEDRPATDATEPIQFRRQFWSYYAGRYPDDGVNPGYGGGSFWTWVESAELNIAASLSQGAVWVWVRGRRRESTADVLPRVQSYGHTLPVEIGTGPYLAVSRHPVEDTRDTSNWDEMAQWIHETIESYKEALSDTQS